MIHEQSVNYDATHLSLAEAVACGYTVTMTAPDGPHAGIAPGSLVVTMEKPIGDRRLTCRRLAGPGHDLNYLIASMAHAMATAEDASPGDVPCECSAGDLPPFDHAPTCPYRLAEIR